MLGEGQNPSDAASWSPLQHREWHAARHATAALRDILIAAGMQYEFPFLRADLNAFGQGFIQLGRISPQAAERLAWLLRVALDCPHNPQNQQNQVAAPAATNEGER